MTSPFRDDRELASFTIERLERENSRLRDELADAQRARPPLPLLSFGFVLALLLALGGLCVAGFLLMHELGGHL
ncbi:MAG: hypothetical protein ABJE95_02110 [Byssovorax sp.]